MMPKVHTRLGFSDGLEIDPGGIVRWVSYLKPGLADHENKPPPAMHEIRSA
jgi:hypothetical protein